VKFIVHIIGVTKAFTKNIISILLIKISWPLDFFINSQIKGTTPEVKNVNNVNLTL
jgi:hypothetical protein